MESREKNGMHKKWSLERKDGIQKKCSIKKKTSLEKVEYVKMNLEEKNDSKTMDSQK